MAVYLLHIDPPVNGKAHYIGYTTRDPELRLKEHLAGSSTFTSAMLAKGSTLRLVYVWPTGDMKFERWLKNMQATKHWCPECGLHNLPLPQMKDMPYSAAERKKRVRV
jgi:predicted GIY-YIG superfamily endonuclease